MKRHRFNKQPTIDVLICLSCHNKAYVPRFVKKQHNHIKTMYCPFCKEERDFIESIRTNLLRTDSELYENVKDLPSVY